MKTFDHAVCPFCALVCDDLTIRCDGNRLSLADDFPQFCRSSYARASEITTTKPRYKGKQITISEATAVATTMLKRAKHPLFGGLIADIQDMRALLPLARQCNATLDHVDSDKVLRNLRVMQSYGVVGTTFSEIRNRADLIIFIGSKLFDDYPRLLQRLYRTTRDSKPRTKSVLIGDWQVANIPEILQGNCDIINTPDSQFPEFIRRFGMHVQQRFNNKLNKATYDEKIAADTPYSALLDDIEYAEYPVIIWSSSDMDYPHADLGITLISRLIKKINLKKHCTGLALRGNRGAGNMQSVCLWQSGYPGHVSFNSEQAYYNPLHNRSDKLLNEQRADLLVWIASIHPQTPPPVDLPTIAFVHPAIAEQTTSDLVVPVGIPGVDHRGYSQRTDSVVILPLPKLRDCALPALPDILRDIQQQLNKKSA
ncbi:MAG: hypothetical protein GDA45_07145 [Chromatiales bacterium]|nr:hypothetical protein [Chromatiales bacterium]